MNPNSKNNRKSNFNVGVFWNTRNVILLKFWYPVDNLYEILNNQ